MSRIVFGDLVAPEGETVEHPDVVEVRGRVVVHDGATLRAPQLKYAIGGVLVWHRGTLDAPALEYVDDLFHLARETTLVVPSLAHVASLAVPAGVSLHTPLLASAEKLYVYKDAAIELPSLRWVGKLHLDDVGELEAAVLERIGEEPVVGKLARRVRRRYIARSATAAHARCGATCVEPVPDEERCRS